MLLTEKQIARCVAVGHGPVDTWLGLGLALGFGFGFGLGFRCGCGLGFAYSAEDTRE